MLDSAFEALKTFDYGTDLATVAAIEETVTSSHGNADARRDLEQRLIAALKSPLSRDAQDYICRKLAVVGTAASVPALSELLVKNENSHMARFALERIPAIEAAAALREALAKIANNLKVGIASSLGQRRDGASVGTLGGLLTDKDSAVARAAALALGAIGSAEAANVLQSAAQSAATAKNAVIDGLLSCAEALLAANKTADSLVIYKSLAGEQQSRLVRLAATRGMLACAGKSL